MKNLAVGFAVGFGVGAGGAYLFISHTRKEETVADRRSGGKYSNLPDHPALKYGVPESDALRVFNTYVVEYDYRTRNPKWVLERITADSLQGEGVREENYYEDPEVEKRFRAKLSDFRGSGYDRGHMAPAANHRSSQEAMDQTFNLSNMSPQVGDGFNRGYWARFERFVQSLAKKSDEVLIATGPLYMPTLYGSSKWTMNHGFIGNAPERVAVPTHFYKVILADSRSGKHGPRQVGIGAFIMPNAVVDRTSPLSAFVVPLEQLEAVAGTKFFPEFVSDDRRKAIDRVAVSHRDVGVPLLGGTDRTAVEETSKALKLPALPESAGTALVTVPKTVGGQGAVHLCEFTACQLPPAWNAKTGFKGDD